MATIGWIDFSEEQRNRARSLMDAAREPGLVDELGIGTVRDYLANRLFPGISTIQTRAKYFVIVPILINEWSNMTAARRRRKPLPDYLHEQETLVRVQLMSGGEEVDRAGVIGSSFGQSTQKTVKRAPSSVYWNGLKTFGIVRADCSIAQLGERLHHERNEYGDAQNEPDGHDAAEQSLRSIPGSANFHREDITLSLTPDESGFLRQRIASSVSNTLLGQLARTPDTTAGLVADCHDQEDLQVMAQHPALRALNAEISHTVSVALQFSDAMEGAHLRYNLLVCRANSHNLSEGRQEDLVEQWQEWVTESPVVRTPMKDLAALEDELSRQSLRIKPYTRTFIRNWFKALASARDNTDALDRLVEQQERDNKKRRARLAGNLGPSDGEQWIGMRQLAYRWPQARQILQDIHDGSA